MNSNKISCQKYVFEQNEYNSSAILELLAKFVSQICHENINKPLDGANLADFGIDIKSVQCQNLITYSILALVSFKGRAVKINSHLISLGGEKIKWEIAL